MNALSILVLAVITLSIISIGVFLCHAMLVNFNNGKVIRQELIKKIENLRYGKALHYFGINQNELVHKASLVEIEKELRNCIGCEHKKKCDNTLQVKEDFKEAEFAFCPNATSMQKKKEYK